MAIAENHLVELLPHRDRRHLLDCAEQVELRAADVLGASDQPSRHIYFPIDAFASLLVSVGGGSVLEVGMVGREGIVGSQLALGIGSCPLNTVVHRPGSSWRVETTAFEALLACCAPLRTTVSRYLHVLMSQLARSSGCVRYHRIGSRLARWLLMCQDRTQPDSFHVTHEFMAGMLGVRRVGVTSAAVALQRRGLIRYHRGDLTVLDRPALEKAACSCYATDRRSYDDWLQ